MESTLIRPPSSWYFYTGERSEKDASFYKTRYIQYILEGSQLKIQERYEIIQSQILSFVKMQTIAICDLRNENKSQILTSTLEITLNQHRIPIFMVYTLQF